MSIILQEINFIQPQHFLTQINKALPSLLKKDLSLMDCYKRVSKVSIKRGNNTNTLIIERN